MGMVGLPKSPFPEFFFDQLLDFFPNVYLSENPCKFRLFGKNFAIVKQEFLVDLTRECLVPTVASV